MLAIPLVVVQNLEHSQSSDQPCGSCKRSTLLHVSQPPACERALLRLEFVYHSPLGRRTHLENSVLPRVLLKMGGLVP